MSKYKFVSTFSHKMEAFVFILLQIFFNAHEKCFQTAYCSLRGMFSFQCSLVPLYKQKNVSLLL